MKLRLLIPYGVLSLFIIVGSVYLYTNSNYSALEVKPCPVIEGEGGEGSLPSDGCEPVPNDCDKGNPPTPVPESVEESRNAADATAEGTRPEIEVVVIDTKADIESGSVFSTVKALSTKVYDSESQAKSELQKKWETSIVPRLKLEYYERGWNKVNTRTTTSANRAKGFFGYQYSSDLEKWGPQVIGKYSFLRKGNANIDGKLLIGGFSYNGQRYDSGFATLDVTGTWNILGDNLKAVASYTCEIGSAIGNTYVSGQWENIGFELTAPFWIKSGNGAYKITLGVGINLIDRSINLPFSLNWSF